VLPPPMPPMPPVPRPPRPPRRSPRSPPCSPVPPGRPSGTTRTSCSPRNSATWARCLSSRASFTPSHSSRSCLSSALEAALSASTSLFSSRSSASGLASIVFACSCSVSRRCWRSRSALRVRPSTWFHRVCWLVLRCSDDFRSDAMNIRSSTRMSISGTAKDGVALPRASANRQMRRERILNIVQRSWAKRHREKPSRASQGWAPPPTMQRAAGFSDGA
ncbi:MAG: hypothetical protein EOO79_02445, partial [Oxalobacteraceae bacterium]